ETSLAEEKLSVMKQLSEAKKAKTDDAPYLADALKEVSEKIVKNAAEIKTATKELEKYTVCTKAFSDAKKLLKQAENYAKFGEIDSIFSSQTV
ncbi:MAG: hypothetical protein MJ120_04300, partial [Clostridia bacterium]|nr:hypothetical protein [Clostridia bacterium]